MAMIPLVFGGCLITSKPGSVDFVIGPLDINKVLSQFGQETLEIKSLLTVCGVE